METPFFVLIVSVLNGLKLILMTTIAFCCDHVSITLHFIAFVCWVSNELTSINNLSRPYAWDPLQISTEVNFWISHDFIWIPWAMRFDSKQVLNSKIDTVHYVLTFLANDGIITEFRLHVMWFLNLRVYHPIPMTKGNIYSWWNFHKIKTSLAYFECQWLQEQGQVVQEIMLLHKQNVVISMLVS